MRYAYRILENSFIEDNFYTAGSIAVTTKPLTVSKLNKKPHFELLKGKEAAAYIGADSVKEEAVEAAKQPTRVEKEDMHTGGFDDIDATPGDAASDESAGVETIN